MALGVQGKQVATGSNGVDTPNLAPGVLSADATGRAIMETDYFDAATVTAKFTGGAIPTSKLAISADLALADGTVAWTGDQSLGGNLLTNVGAPTAQSDVLPEQTIPTMTVDDKGLTPAATSGDNETTSLALTNTPFNGGAVIVLVNGWKARLGDGVLTRDCYFSADGGTSAKAFSALVATDVLYWNGVIAGFDLEASDRVDLLYLV